MNLLTKEIFTAIQQEYAVATDIKTKEKLCEMLLSYHKTDEVNQKDRYKLYETISDDIAQENLTNSTQICPLCGAKVIDSHRYPNYVCGDCMVLATNEAGEKVEFFNADLAGGIVGFIRGTQIPYQSDVCYIKNVMCTAKERYLGGIVIIPIGH